MMRSLRINLVSSLGLAIALLVPVLAYGQAGSTGTIVGTVTDQSGAVIVGAEVKLTDRSTGTFQVQPTSQVGRFTFSDVKPGSYDVEVTMKGFRKLMVPAQEVVVGQSTTLNLTLEVGAATQTVEVTTTPGAELQTLNSTIGSAITGNAILQLPTFSRDATSLLYFQATAVPDFNGATGNMTSGTVAGQTSDQNTFSIDGGNATDTLSGDNGYITGFAGNGTAAVPTPVESVEEFNVTTSNATADFSNSSGGHAQLVTKRGTNSFHGSVYDYLQNSALDSNDWSNNFTAQPKPGSKYNRFGGALGGPLLPPMAGGKTYFYVNYEGFRWPESSIFERDVPSPAMRAGTLQFRDANGVVQSYNLNGKTGCGPAGANACDPLGVGMNAFVSNMWSTYLPAANDLNAGDHLNTFGFQAPVSIPQSQNFVVGRIDHDFGSRLRWFSSYRWYDSNSPTTDQVDIGGLLPGDTLGAPKSTSVNKNSPRYFVTGLTATLNPSVTNDFHFSFLRDQWSWSRGGFLPQGSTASVPVELGEQTAGEPGPGNSLMPINVNTQNSRQRLWDGHNSDFRDTLSWLRGTHFFKFGGEFMHDWWHFNRYDDVVAGLANTIVDAVGWNNGQITIPATSQPIPCTAAVSSGCLPSTELGSWNALYSDVLGLVSQSQTLVSRAGSNLNLNPIGTPLESYMLVHTFNLYFSDSWRIKPRLTLTYGLSWGYQTPPYAPNGAQDMLVDSSGNPLSVFTYLQSRLTAAENGGTYAPIIGYSPPPDVGGPGGTHYPYQPYYAAFQPRVALAWTPHAGGGWLGALLGNNATVLRGGYSRFYDRNSAIGVLTDSVLGDGPLQPVDCSAPLATGSCSGFGGSTPSTAFRIGSGAGGNGAAAPLPAIPQTLQIPVEPGINNGGAASYVGALSAGINNYLPPGYADEINFTIQRQLKGNVLVEVGYVGNWDKHLYQGIDLNDVPWMMKLNGQTFAQAYDNLWMQLKNGTPVTAQPFFEAALGGPKSAYCGAFTSCSAAVAANEGPSGTGNLTAEYVTSLWSDLDTSFNFAGTAYPGPQLLSTTQCYWCYYQTSAGIANYNAFIATVQKRTGHGLTLSGNFTYGHALGTLGLSQTYTLDNLDDPWSPKVDYGPQYFDHKFLATIIASYELPFGPGRRYLNSSNPVLKRVLGGWTFAPIFSVASGQPLDVYTGSFQEFGAGFAENGAAAVPLVNTASLSNSAHQGINPTGAIGADSAAANGGPGVNMFSNPTQVYNDFFPCLVGICNRGGGGGQLRGPSLWNLDFSINKTTTLTERVKLEFFSEWFNGLNHMAWGGDGMSYSLQNPYGFGTLGQFNPLQGNYTRIIQLGLRMSF